MKKVDFYLISDSLDTARFRLACRIAEKAYKEKHQIYMHTNDESVAESLDALLWTFRDISFVPHQIAGAKAETLPPIEIGYHDEKPVEHGDIMINLNDYIPSFYHTFDRIIEIVNQDSETQERLREHYKFYQKHAYKIETHDLR